MADRASEISESPPARGGEAEFWLRQISDAGRIEREWRKKATELEQRYKNEAPDNRKRRKRLNIFWSNIQTLKPAVFSATPKPDVRRRNIHDEPTAAELGKQAAIALERCLEFAVGEPGFTRSMEAARDDTLIVGRGVAREVYESDTVRRADIQVIRRQAPAVTTVGLDGVLVEQAPVELPPAYLLDGSLVEPDGFDREGRPFIDQTINERTETRHVYWADFRMAPARCWDDVWWVAFRHTPTRRDLVKQFGATVGRKVRLTLAAGDTSSGDLQDQPKDPEHAFGRAEVWEVWHKTKLEVLWVSDGLEKPLGKDAPPVEYRDFWPCPCPLYAVPVNDSMVPVPEFDLYEDQANELDHLQGRIGSLVDQCKAVGICDADFVELMSLKDVPDGTFKPMERKEESAGALSDQLWRWPLENVIQVIMQLGMRAENVKLQIFEITGITDLRRGSGTRERESATAQNLKASFSQVRMTPRSKPMAEFARDLLRIKAEIIAEQFEPASIEQHAGMLLDPAAVELLRSERLRHMAIDVETDSTVAADAQAEKGEAVEFTTHLTGFISGWAPILQSYPQAAPLFGALLKEATKPFKFSRNLEEVIDATVTQIQAQPAAPPTPPGGSNGADPAALVSALSQPGALQ
ncbi:MAG TPA: hypothetical protein VMW68_08540 [Methyloceanibacter sp.]|nr:hypothetical protein [Methyloceanibacter sp.]